MSQENVEIVRGNRDALQRGDIDAFLKTADPEIEIDFSEVRGPNRGVFAATMALGSFLRPSGKPGSR